MTLVWIEGQPEELLAGMLVEVDGNLFFVGNVNEEGGVCDDCQDVRISRVARYSISAREDLMSSVGPRRLPAGTFGTRMAGN